MPTARLVGLLLVADPLLLLRRGLEAIHGGQAAELVGTIACGLYGLACLLGPLLVGLRNRREALSVQPAGNGEVRNASAGVDGADRVPGRAVFPGPDGWPCYRAVI